MIVPPYEVLLPFLVRTCCATPLYGLILLSDFAFIRAAMTVNHQDSAASTVMIININYN